MAANKKVIPVIVLGLLATGSVFALIQFQMARAATVEYKVRHIADQVQGKKIDLLDAATKMGDLGEPAVPYLIQVIKEYPEPVKFCAKVAISHIGSPAIPYLAKALKTETDFSVKCHYLESLPTVGVDASELLPVILDWIHDNSEPEFRRLAAEKCVWLGPKAIPAIPALRELLNDWCSAVRAAAAQALGYIGAPAAAALPRLHELINDKDETVRQEAVYAVKQIENASENATQPSSRGSVVPLR
jgi:HEAT repeat protein